MTIGIYIYIFKPFNLSLSKRTFSLKKKKKVRKTFIKKI